MRKLVATYDWRHIHAQVHDYMHSHPGAQFNRTDAMARHGEDIVYFRSFRDMHDAFRVAGMEFGSIDITDDRVPSDVRDYLMSRIRTSAHVV